MTPRSARPPRSLPRRPIPSTTCAGAPATSARWPRSGPNARSARSREARAPRERRRATREGVGRAHGSAGRGAVRPRDTRHRSRWRRRARDAGRPCGRGEARARRNRRDRIARRDGRHGAAARRRGGSAHRRRGARIRRSDGERRRADGPPHRERRCHPRAHRRARSAAHSAPGRQGARGVRGVPARGGRGALIHPELLDKPERRIDGVDKTTGAARYTADLVVPRVLEAAFVRSPHPHARILSAEMERARALAGVRAVLTGADVRGQRLGRRLQDWPVLCWDRVLFVGDRVAAVAAHTCEIAEETVRLISVEYEELPPLLDVDAALRADAAVLHPDAASYRFLEGRGERPAVPHPNLQGHAVESHGDVEAAFARAARVFEHEFTTPRIHQAPLEPRAAIVWLAGAT